MFVELSDWVSTAGDQFREGSIQLLHPGKDLVIGAQLHLTDSKHSLSFEEKLTELGKGSPRLEGVWWLPSPKGTVSLVLSNTGINRTLRTVRCGPWHQQQLRVSELLS